MYERKIVIHAYLFFFVLLDLFPYILSSLCFSVFVLFHSCSSHAQVFGKTLVHESHISYIRTEWNFLSSLSETGDKLWKQSAVILNSILII